jgi:hypothetical protein
MPADPPVVATLARSLIDEIVPDGARRMLAGALEAEFADRADRPENASSTAPGPLMRAASRGEDRGGRRLVSG